MTQRMDIQDILDQWPYQSGEVQVRYVDCADGRRRIQMRLDLGLLQLELDGRPDGTRPEGFESLLHYYQQRKQAYLESTGTMVGFQLTPEECSRLRHEALQYYYRYLSCFHLGDYERVVRDTTRNLEVFDLLRHFAAEEDDKTSLEPYRPYVLMMQARAKAEIARAAGRLEDALMILLEGIEKIRAFFESIERQDMVEKSAEIANLRALQEEILQQVPNNPVEALRREMKRAVTVEDYERAALLRDEIQRLQQQAPSVLPSSDSPGDSEVA